MINLDYSVGIRTLGTAGEKYKTTIQAIKNQTVKPKEIIVVIDDKSKIDSLYQCGLERFVVRPRGMVRQRIDCIKENSSDWLLLLDDDVSFGENFVEKMFETSLLTQTFVVEPVVKDVDSALGNSIKKKSIHSLMGGVIHWLLGVSMKGNIGDLITKISKTGGFVSNNQIDKGKQYYSQSGHGTCCFASQKALQKICLEEELWLERTGYALPDDQIMFYKLYCKGFIISVNTEVNFVHLDAKTGNFTFGKKRKLAYASAHNGLIFWHRFIYNRSKTIYEKILCVLAFSRRFFFTLSFAFIKGLVKMNMSQFTAYCKGYKDGILFLKTKDYKILPPI